MQFSKFISNTITFILMISLRMLCICANKKFLNTIAFLYFTIAVLRKILKNSFYYEIFELNFNSTLF